MGQGWEDGADRGLMHGLGIPPPPELLALPPGVAPQRLEWLEVGPVWLAAHPI